MKKMIINLLIVLLVMGFLKTGLAQSKDEAFNLAEQGRKAFNQGSYDEALKYYEEALKINRELKRPEGIALNLSQIGWVYLDLNRMVLALKNFKEGLKVGREAKIPEGTALNLRGLAAVYHIYGRYDQALKYYEEALEIDKELSVLQEAALCLTAIALVYTDLGRNDDALKYIGDALKMGRELKTLVPPQLLNNIGMVFSALGRYGDALKIYEEALEINKKRKNTLGVYSNLNNIGWTYLALRDYQKAEEFFKKAVKESQDLKKETINLRSGFSVSPGLIETYLRTEKYKEALKLLNERQVERFASQPPPTKIRYHTQKGFALKGLGMLKDASGEFLEAVSLIEEIRQKVAEETASFFEARGRLKAYQGLVATLSERVMKGESKDSRFSPYGKNLPSAAFYFSESTKARVLLEEIVRAEKGKQRGDIPEKLRDKLQDCMDQLSEIDAKLEAEYQWDREGSGRHRRFAAAKYGAGRFEERKKWHLSELNDLVKEIREKYPRYALLYYPKPLPPESMPLRDDELLLEYSLGDEASYLFVVRKGGVKKIIKIPIGRGILEEKVRSFMEPMQTRQYSFSVKKAKDLYDILLAGALGDAKENEKVIIISEGILGLLPFEALVVREGARVEDSVYVGDKYSLSYYQSAAVLDFTRSIQAEKAGKVLFALGNPIFNKEDPRYVAWKNGKKEQVLVASLDQYSFRALAAGRGVEVIGKDQQKEELAYNPLPETEREVVEISRIMGVEPTPPDVLLSVMANETELRKVKLDNYRYIHFATHADLPGEVQGIYEPFILLGQVENRDGDDGLLTLSEVLGLQLNADMVVLSACLTGRGKVMDGEGVINFARAFQHAGAQSVVVSLWEVASNEAVDYMKIFYGYLKAGKGRAEALRLARKEIKAKYPNPFFWAVFILHGEG